MVDAPDLYFVALDPVFLQGMQARDPGHPYLYRGLPAAWDQGHQEVGRGLPRVRAPGPPGSGPR